jgi:hypothetical protein
MEAPGNGKTTENTRRIPGGAETTTEEDFDAQ